MKRHAEVVGGGLAGLTAAIALANRGWTVTLHERSQELREIGAGLYLKENGLRALEAISVATTGLAQGVRLQRIDVCDVAARKTISRDVSSIRVYTVVRTDLHRAMAAAAASAGVEIRTGSEGLAATPDGQLTLASGEVRPAADLLVAADGVWSRIRESLGLGTQVRVLPEGATRLLVPRQPGERAEYSVEYWAGRRRLLVTPCSRDQLYLALMAPEADRRAVALPVDVPYWAEAFPNQSGLLRRIDRQGTHHVNVRVVVRGWRVGRCCLLGDTAHGQPPNLGQGAGLAISNAVALADSLDQDSSVDTGLARWEARWRPTADSVQRWSYWYGVLAYRWPAFLDRARVRALTSITKFGPTRQRYTWLWQGGLEDTRGVRVPSSLGPAPTPKLLDGMIGGVGR